MYIWWPQGGRELTNFRQITEIRDAEDCYFTQEETAACVDEAHKHKKRVCSHARARDSVQQSIDFGVDVIYHASYIDEKGGLLSITMIDYI
jgi:imidazolonepropionase-like amidohydrolase